MTPFTPQRGRGAISFSSRTLVANSALTEFSDPPLAAPVGRYARPTIGREGRDPVCAGTPLCWARVSSLAASGAAPSRTPLGDDDGSTVDGARLEVGVRLGSLIQPVRRGYRGQKPSRRHVEDLAKFRM
jgi:hypothetical protein